MKPKKAAKLIKSTTGCERSASKVWLTEAWQPPGRLKS